MVGIKDVAPDLLMPEGCLTRATPDENAAADIARGREVLRALSPFDIGQAAVVIDGHVVGVEDIEGTDGLLARVARLRSGRPHSRQGGPRRAGEGAEERPGFALRSADDRSANRRGRRRGAACRDRDRRRQHHCRRTAGHDRGRRRRRPFRDRSARVMPARATADVARKIFLIATEESGDRLGASLMKVLRQRLGDAVRFEGVGGQSMAREGLAVAVSDRGTVDHGTGRGREAVAEDLAADPGNRRRGDGSLARHSRDHRQPRFHPSGGKTRPGPRSLDPDRRLRIALGLGVAAGPGARDARLCRSCPGLAAVRAGGLSQAARPALQLCRPSPDRADRQACGPMPRSRSAATGRRRFCWCCREAAAARSGTIWRCSARRWAGCAAEGVAFELILPTMPHLQEAVGEGVRSWTVAPRIVVGEQEKRAAFRIAHAALAKSGTVTLELALAGVPMVAAYKAGAVEAWIMRRVIQVELGHPGQSGDRRECRAGIHPAGLHAGKAVAGAARHA